MGQDGCPTTNHGAMNQHKITNTRHLENGRVNWDVICNIIISDRITLFFFPFCIHVALPPLACLCAGLNVYACVHLYAV